MGTIKQGILGGFSGKVGTVVGASWKGIAYMRSLAQSVKNPRTRKQSMHRELFMKLIGLMSQFEALLNVTFKERAVRMSAYNAATKANYANGLVSYVGDSLTVNPDRLIIAQGSLPGVQGGAVTINSGMAKMTWDDNSSEEGADATDKVVAVLFNTVRNQIHAISSTGKTRSSGSYSNGGFDSWAGDSVACYIAFVRDDGSAASDSAYLGTVTLPSE